MADNEAPTNELASAAHDLVEEGPRSGARKRRDPNQPSAVVGLGASAGGVAVLQQFFADMKPNTGLAFVVVIHLSPEHESQLASVIQQKTSMPVAQVNAALKVRPNHVYVIPPNKQLAFTDGMLQLVEPQKDRGRRVAIDLFFRTLAQAYGQRAVCIIMSGSDSDGVIGLKHVRAQGGVTIVQDPNEAEYDSMPLTAIRTGMVDWVLPVAEMPSKLAEFVENENRMRLPPEIEGETEPDVKADDAPGGETVSDETRDTEDEEAIGKVLADVRAQTGHDFSHYKRATVLRRIARRLQVNSLDTIPKYLDFLRTHPAEARALLHDLLIGVTHFFRDREAFAALEAHIPQLFSGKEHDDEVRVWVAGCATGEEAYSIAILLSEQAHRLDTPPKIQIFATDLDDESVADARQGIYPSTIEADVTPGRLREFFARDHGRYRIRKEIREKVLFASHNLLTDAPFSRCDMIVCRNLLIYLKTDSQKQAFDIFHFALRSGGLLFLGSAEHHGAGQTLFAPVDAKHRIFVRRSTPRPSWRVPNLPLGTTPGTGRPGSGWRSRYLPPLTQNVADETAGATLESRYAGQARREALFGELHLRLLEEYGPPSVVVNDSHDIVHLSESAGHYLHFAAGEPTANIVKVIHPALQIEVRTALFKASQTKQSVQSAPQQLVFDGGGSETVILEVRPTQGRDQAAGFYLVLFEKQDAEVEAPAHVITRASSMDATDEVQFLKEQLAATTEQYEARNEELKASNEELQAMNEEMRSATEELETSKEELQSVNEELTTVNTELKNSVDELGRANTDLNNLMASTDIGTIFLDRQLRIQRFTPSAQKIFNLISSDLGRPISDITSSLNYDGLTNDIEQVLADLHTIEREMRVGENGPWYLTRLAPYRTSDDRIAGVVVTFIDITRRKIAEDAVRDSEAKFRTLSDTAPALIWFNDAEGNNQFVNRRYLEFSGKSAEEVAGKGWQLMVHPDDLESVVAEYAAARREHRPYHYVLRARRADGEWRWMETFAQPLFDAKGAYIGHVGVSPDITERKQAEEAVRASEERFRTVADNVPQLIWANDVEGKANYFNKRWFDYTGLSLEQSCEAGWQTVIHPEDAPAAIERWKEALAKSEVFDAEFRLRGADGEYRWFIGRSVPIHNGAATALSWFGSATDIQKLKEAEKSLRATEERFRLLVEGAKDYAMFLMDLDNRITFWSNGAERVFGWTEAEAVGQTGALIFVPEDLANGAVEQEIGTAMNEGRAVDRRWHLRKDGSQIWVEGVMSRIDDADGAPRGLAKICRDATAERAAEESLRQAKQELEVRVRERTRDLQAINTELERTMAQRLALEKELLEISEREKRRIGEDLHDLVCQELTATALLLKSAANRVAQDAPAAAQTLGEAAEIVNRNVGLTRDLARGLQPADLTGAGLRGSLKALAQLSCEGTNIKCHFKATRGTRVTDDTVALALYRIAQEAVKNAIKHSRAKNIFITLDSNKDFVCLSVEDDGKGIARGRRNKGLGLHIMSYRANALGGEFVIHTRKRGGTEVRCKIPRSRSKSGD